MTDPLLYAETPYFWEVSVYCALHLILAWLVYLLCNIRVLRRYAMSQSCGAEWGFFLFLLGHTQPGSNFILMLQIIKAFCTHYSSTVVGTFFFLLFIW